MKQADKWIRASFVVILSFAGCLFAYAMFFADGTGEVDVGSFSVSELSEG